MRALYGLSNHSILHVQRTLKGLNKDLRLQTLDTDSYVKPGAEVVLVPGLSNFVRARKDLNASAAVVFIFDTPAALEYVKPLQLLDAKRVAPFRYTYREVTPDVLKACLSLQSEPIKATSTAVDVIPKLLDSTFPSIMKPVLTFLYSVSDLEKRLLFRFQILTYMMNPKIKSKEVKQTLIELSKQRKSFKQLDELITFLDTDPVKRTRKVLRKISKAKRKGKGVNIDSLCEEYRVNSFDVRYVSKAYQADKQLFVVNEEEPPSRKSSTKKTASKGK